MIFELQLSLNQVTKATFSVEQLLVGDKDFATTITSVSSLFPGNKRHFPRIAPWRDLPPLIIAEITL